MSTETQTVPVSAEPIDAETTARLARMLVKAKQIGAAPVSETETAALAAKLVKGKRKAVIKAKANGANGKAVTKAKAAKPRKANGKAKPLPFVAESVRDNPRVKAALRELRRRRSNGGAKGGGKALPDFGEFDVIKVLNRKALKREFGERAACFRTGQTWRKNREAQRAAGFKINKRKSVRKAFYAGYITFA